MTTTHTTAGKMLEVVLTGRAPVRFAEVAWPVIAEATGQTPWRQAGNHEPDYEHDHYCVRVRQHADGRTLVYGVVDACSAGWRKPAGGIDRQEGELLAAGEDVVAAIRRVCETAGIPGRVAREAVAGLPAETI